MEYLVGFSHSMGTWKQRSSLHNIFVPRMVGRVAKVAGTVGVAQAMASMAFDAFNLEKLTQMPGKSIAGKLVVVCIASLAFALEWVSFTLEWV